MNSHFLDSNICVYMFDGNSPAKQDKAIVLLKKPPCISSQVVIETYLACLRKLKLPAEICDENIRLLSNMTDVCPIYSNDFELALHIKSKYLLSFLDSVIVASALQANCSTLYSEDLHHGLVIENKLTVINPFI